MSSVATQPTTLANATEKRERDESENPEGLDESALAKKARKDARVSVTYLPPTKD
jgi:hypothetical protein